MAIYSALAETHPFALALVVISLWAVVLSPFAAAYAVWRHLRYMRRITSAIDLIAAHAALAGVREIAAAPELPAEVRDRLLKGAMGQ